MPVSLSVSFAVSLAVVSLAPCALGQPAAAVLLADVGDAGGAEGAALSTPAQSLTLAELDRMLTTVGRAEASRRVRVLGDRAVPALIAARGNPSAETRAWATTQLETLGKRSPGDAVQTDDNLLLADVLRAYASIHDVDALPVALSFVNSDRAVVRESARDAVLAYGKDATRRLREAYAALVGGPAPAGMAADELARSLFEAYDRARLQDVYALLDRGLSKQRAGRSDEAVADFDAVLARQPLLDRRAEMAPAYVALGESLETTDRQQALAHLRRALRLAAAVEDAGSGEASHIRSELAYVEGEDLLARGIADAVTFEEALALDPHNEHARARLVQLRTRSAASRATGYRVATAGAVLVAALAGIVAMAARWRRR